LLEISRKKPVLKRAPREIKGAIVAIATAQTPMVFGLGRKTAGGNMRCVICERCAPCFSTGSYNLGHGKFIETSFYYCPDCDCFIRQRSNTEFLLRLESAGYTQLENERRFVALRRNFHEYLYELASARGKPCSWLEFGCAYGHLIELVQDKGVLAAGIEINDRMLEYCKKKRLDVTRSVHDLASHRTFDVISLIDSLYYVDNPRETLKALSSHLESDGILLIRVTNRNWLARLRKKFLNRPIGSILGDCTVGYSLRSLRKLLETNGFHVTAVHYYERGKRLEMAKRCFYILTAIFSFLSGGKLIITPGIVVIAERVPGTDFPNARSSNSAPHLENMAAFGGRRGKGEAVKLGNRDPHGP
jgi:2-polyprenyl-3-methyl-5-hydroxy-6-metoxy-1,4-benzoquinol methylase